MLELIFLILLLKLSPLLFIMNFNAQIIQDLSKVYSFYLRRFGQFNCPLSSFYFCLHKSSNSCNHDQKHKNSNTQKFTQKRYLNSVWYILPLTTLPLLCQLRRFLWSKVQGQSPRERKLWWPGMDKGMKPIFWNFLVSTKP